MIDYDKIPFAYRGDSDRMSKQIPHRLKAVKKFIGRDISTFKTLDIGTSNEFGRRLGLKDNTLETDLNSTVEAPSQDYDLIGCFEVIEHLMNPLMLLVRCHSLLQSSGVLYLSTPRPFFGFLQGPQHLTEYKKSRMIQMLDYAGFEVTKTQKIRFWEWSFMFYGFRPIFRTLFHRCIIYECVKK
jgi:hypothetical protein